MPGSTETQREFDFVPALRMCGSLKGVALLYAYTNTCGRPCCYVKLETHKALSLEHGVSAFQTYALGIKKQTGGPTRRETEVLSNMDAKMNGRSFCSEDALCRQVTRGYDTCGRVGAEVFVPAAFSDRVLSGPG